MTRDRFAANPFPDVHVSELERQELIELVAVYVEDYIKKYEEFVQVHKRKVDKRRWRHVRSKANLHVYAERTRKELKRRGIEPENSLSATQRLRTTSPAKDLPVFLSVGTFIGELDDLMYGVVNPTLNDMRIKASYVHDIHSAAVLCPVVGPIKSRDFVYIEATGIPLEWRPRGLPFTTLYRFPTNHSLTQQDPERISAGAMLSATNYVYCGQMKKLAWMLQRHHSAYDVEKNSRRERMCGMFEENDQCHWEHWEEHVQNLLRCVCYSCKIRQNISFIVAGGKLIQRKVVVCAKCVCESTQWNAQEAARDQITDFEACMNDQGCTSYEACTVSCELSILESSASIRGR
ncbi:hypothetical protein GN244_ATG12729 [Phytophthora infestans]|uniref:Uncharacterized protein n=1 Tax=Phytophthora infestans TaxID=4787 RepID=A0A833SPY3_PHYIN|nr:hypothetical protein GN244_ATG12729 [Phytophthora infestans]